MTLAFGLHTKRNLEDGKQRMKVLLVVAMASAAICLATATSALGAPAQPPGRETVANSDSTDPGAAGARDYTVAKGDYTPPDVVLTDSHGKKVRLVDLLSRPHPVLLQFVFTSCTTVCPILSATFSQAQHDLANVSKDYEMISISIDPEYDTPARLDAYARRYHPAGNWIFLTGKREDIARVLRAFDALYQSDNKMYHRPYTFLHARAGAPWRRLEGYLRVSDLLTEYRSALDDAGATGR